MLEEETAKNPHPSKNTQLSHCGHRETPDVAEIGEVRVEAGELLGQFPHGDDENKAVEDDDDADGREETPHKFKREPTVSISAVSPRIRDGRDNDDGKRDSISHSIHIEMF